MQETLHSLINTAWRDGRYMHINTIIVIKCHCSYAAVAVSLINFAVLQAVVVGLQEGSKGCVQDLVSCKNFDKSRVFQLHITLNLQ